MEKSTKVLIATGITAAVLVGALVGYRYYVVSKKEEQEANSPIGKLEAEFEHGSEECGCKTFWRRLRKALDFSDIIEKIKSQKAKCCRAK